jgi:hypothetical protein
MGALCEGLEKRRSPIPGFRLILELIDARNNCLDRDILMYCEPESKTSSSPMSLPTIEGYR